MVLIERLQTNVTVDALCQSFVGKGLSFFLDSSMHPGGLGDFSYLGADPYLIFQSKGDEVEINRCGVKTRLIANPLDVLQGLLAEHAIPVSDGLPFTGGAVGYFAYDSYPCVESIRQTAPEGLGLPDIYLGFYDAIVAIDHSDESVLAVACGVNAEPEERLLGEQAL